MKIEIWSDIVCPYCYIGKRVFEAALKKFPMASDVEIVWRSYQLDPSLKAGEKIDIYQYMADMEEISYEEAVAGRQAVAKMAAQHGLEYNFDRSILTNTLDAHRLVHLAEKSGLGGEAEELLYKAYFTDGLDVSDKTVLAQIGKQIGLDENTVKSTLDGNEFLDEVQEDINEADRLDLYYVPFFLFDRKHIVTGVVTEDDFLKVLNKIQSGDENMDMIEGQSCGLDGVCR